MIASFIRWSSIVSTMTLVTGVALAAPIGVSLATTDRTEMSPRVEQALFIRGGCTAGLDKVCTRKRGKTVCRCQS